MYVLYTSVKYDITDNKILGAASFVIWYIILPLSLQGKNL